MYCIYCKYHILYDCAVCTMAPRPFLGLCTNLAINNINSDSEMIKK